LAELAALCRAVEQVFSGHFQTNIYLSPPNAQGFGTHFDSHDVFVLQVAGSKLWTLYDTVVELPLRGQAFDKDKHHPEPPSREIVIRAGDLFYCPRGLFHSARSSNGHTIGCRYCFRAPRDATLAAGSPGARRRSRRHGDTCRRARARHRRVQQNEKGQEARKKAQGRRD
jgi:ribosomal protein L16 Arg81 hydroxylase